MCTMRTESELNFHNFPLYFLLVSLNRNWSREKYEWMMATRFEKWRTVGGFCARFLLIGAPTNWNLARFLLVLQRAELDLARGCTGFRRVSKHPQRRVRLRVVCVCVCCLFFLFLFWNISSYSLGARCASLSHEGEVLNRTGLGSE